METEKRRKESESDSESATNKKLKLESASIITNDPPKNEEKKEEKKEEKTEVKTEKEEKITTASIIITDTKTDEKTEEKSEDQKEPPKVDEQIIKDLEIQILTKMRDYKENRIKDQVTYSDINLQELLNPSERLESIIFHSTKRHAANNLHMESVADNAIRLIEQEQQLVKILTKTEQILDSSSLINDLDLDIKENLNKIKDFQIIFISKIQKVRERITYIYARKRELLKFLKERYAEAYLEEMEQDTS